MYFGHMYFGRGTWIPAPFRWVPPNGKLVPTCIFLPLDRPKPTSCYVMLTVVLLDTSDAWGGLDWWAGPVACNAVDEGERLSRHTGPRIVLEMRSSGETTTTEQHRASLRCHYNMGMCTSKQGEM